MLDIASAAPHLLATVSEYVRADLMLAIGQKSFRVTDEAAAVDLCMGSCSRAMLGVAHGRVGTGHDVAVTTMLLRGLGMSFNAAAQVASRPLPPFPPLQPAPAQAASAAAAPP